MYWEAENYKDWNFVPEYCVNGSDTATFLENKLAELGLTEHEANEFIIYWLPRMKSNNYNLISFNTEEYEQRAELTTIPKLDTMIRVFMTFKASDKEVKTNEPAITTPLRQGFTVVEWGGSEINETKQSKVIE